MSCCVNIHLKGNSTGKGWRGTEVMFRGWTLEQQVNKLEKRRQKEDEGVQG